MSVTRLSPTLGCTAVQHYGDKEMPSSYWKKAVTGPKQSYMGALCIHLSFQQLLHTDRLSLAVLHFASHSLQHGGKVDRRTGGDLSITTLSDSLHRCHCYCFWLFLIRRQRSHLLAFSGASGRQPRPSILFCLPLISISPTSHHIKATDAHISLYISVSLTVVDSVVVRHSGPSPTNSLITAHSPKCVCNVGNHFQ